MPWSLVKEWPLDEYDREVAYEEIKTIMTQSLDEAGSIGGRATDDGFPDRHGVHAADCSLRRRSHWHLVLASPGDSGRLGPWTVTSDSESCGPDQCQAE